MKGYYEPKFYEVRALAYLAQLLGKPIVANLRLSYLHLPMHERPEIDGFVEVDGKEWAIEIKSYPLDDNDANEIITKYKSLGFTQLMIVAPQIEKQELLLGDIRVRFLPHEPDISPIIKYYQQNTFLENEWVLSELKSGWYHFRYKLAERGAKRLAWVLNQTDKRIKTEKELLYEIQNRIPPHTFPIRVYWSVNQWLSPKDLFFAKRPNILISKRIVFDIDGDSIHRPFFPCQIDAQGMCEYCFRFAKQHVERLIEYLQENGIHRFQVVFSGWRGFHLYILDNSTTLTRKQLVKGALQRKIRIDHRVTLHDKGVIGVPGTMHGHSMKPLVTVPNLSKFTWNEVQRL